jgi:hypothetical protein
MEAETYRKLFNQRSELEAQVALNENGVLLMSPELLSAIATDPGVVNGLEHAFQCGYERGFKDGFACAQQRRLVCAACRHYAHDPLDPPNEESDVGICRHTKDPTGSAQAACAEFYPRAED